MEKELQEQLARMKETRRADLTKVYAGYTLAELEDAFDSVKAEKNWKNPINKIMKLDEIDVDRILASIEYFCGGGGFVVPTVEDHVRICAPGYYSIIGA